MQLNISSGLEMISKDFTTNNCNFFQIIKKSSLETDHSSTFYHWWFAFARVSVYFKH